MAQMDLARCNTSPIQTVKNSKERWMIWNASKDKWPSQLKTLNVNNPSQVGMIYWKEKNHYYKT